MRVIIVLTGCLAFGASAEAKECYRRVVLPPQYETVAETVLASPEREALEYVPAVTRTVEETVVVRPAQTITHVAPARYSVELETVEVAPAHREWRERDEEGEAIGCWVDVPPRYASVAHEVLVEPAHEVSEEIPEEVATRARTEVVEPAHAIAHTIPASYVARERVVLVAPARLHWAPIEGACER